MVPGPSGVLDMTTLVQPRLNSRVHQSFRSQPSDSTPPPRVRQTPSSFVSPRKAGCRHCLSCPWTALEQGWCSRDQGDHQAWQPHGNSTTKRHNRPSPPGKPKGCGEHHLQCPESRISGGSTEPQVQDTRPIPYKEIPISLTRSRLSRDQTLSKVTEFHLSSMG